MSNIYAPDVQLGISIPEVCTKDNVTFYQVTIAMASQDVHWKVERRYRDFAELHETLLECGVSKESLPQKKYIGNKEAQFVMKRRKDLESYLQSVTQFLKCSIPESLARFLELDKFDVNYILRDLAGEHFDRLAVGREDPWLFEAIWTPLELFSLSQRLKSPLPPQDPGSKRWDFTNVADRVCQMKALKVNGHSENLGLSNICPNQLKYDFLAFKNLTKLILSEVVCSPDQISAFGNVRHTLTHFSVNKCHVESIAHLLLCDTPFYNLQDDGELAQIIDANPNFVWRKLQVLDLRYNDVKKIDRSVTLAPLIETFLLGSNKVTDIENLTTLPKLSHLELADNDIHETDDLHIKLGQVTRLDLSHNKIKTLAGWSKLYSLKNVNVSNNRIRELKDVFPLSQLPCLEVLNLQGNKVTSVVDYRIKLFESFGKRCSELCLDNENPSQREIDRVSILMALRVAKEGLPPTTLFGNLPKRVS
ncbi:hypothetical protein TCAL_04582 [Tigriopus californicus]|uniref:PX domain-containing protein n=1 Tax=Tigriopus californicus TaxID=6832 RepID=A0A553PD94_TIGCA|nr:nischarin-like [Tigriopus californicus]TRY75649.1 hypothetical protein TCAL_04582 [Tigriopus californicus]|eukprot:TCALIF_04582-PA protein Name:"Similar to NISCH Nischarin (Homo sapiens)" AED:0.01 eAED:0.01 QI:0/-1/0/1/-1/1/1/0/476